MGCTYYICRLLNNINTITLYQINDNVENLNLNFKMIKLLQKFKFNFLNRKKRRTRIFSQNTQN